MLSALALAVTACRGEPAPRPDLILLVVDALRADHVPADRVTPGLTPFLDALAQQAAVFRNARAQSSWTSPSIASLLTSRYPSQHGVVAFRSQLSADEVTLPEKLREAGYRTAAFSGNVLLEPRVGFGQGFEEFVSLGRRDGDAAAGEVKPRAAAIDRAALQWLESLPRVDGQRPPFFVYLHYMETHTPYAPEPEVLDEVLTARGRTPAERRRLGELLFQPGQLEHPTQEMADRLEDLYAAELASLDRELQRFFAQLAERGLLERAFVVFTADHGEEFLDHGGLGHGRTLQEEVVRVPLWMRGAGSEPKGREVADTVSLIDVAPTILEVAGIPAVPSFEGRSLASHLENPRWPDRLRATLCASLGLACAPRESSFAELLRLPQRSAGATAFDQRSVVQEGSKLIQRSDGEVRTYDLAPGAAEADGVGLPPERSEALRATLAAHVARTAKGGAAVAPHDIDPATRDHMRALGYSADEP